MKELRTSEKFRIYRRVGKLLREQHPYIFPKRGRRPPLKEGILQELIALHRGDTTATHIRVFLRIWTNSTSYLQSVSRGGDRIGLGGVIYGSVLDPHAAEAKERIRERRMKSNRHNC